ncbi:MAG: hypothetical protein A2Y40_09005 [Candidatus Margulisbacteria bacterium GWF2_35_9]|nr:MAG: hypothetical protein A2Y40_09005 [Candidatus Margulisbacteria bacterium GWF2_35_9]
MVNHVLNTQILSAHLRPRIEAVAQNNKVPIDIKIDNLYINKIEQLMKLAKEEEKLLFFDDPEKFKLSKSRKFLQELTQKQGLEIIQLILEKERFIQQKFDLLTVEREQLSNHITLGSSFFREIYRVNKGFPDFTTNIFYHSSLRDVWIDYFRNRDPMKSIKILLVCLLSVPEKNNEPTDFLDQADVFRILGKINAKLNIPIEQTIEFGSNYFSSFDPERKVIRLATPFYKTDVLHEYGHFLFRNLIFNHTEKYGQLLKELDMIYEISKNKIHYIPLYSLFDESNYGHTYDSIDGHPYDSLEEFFASSFNILNNYNEMAKFNSLKFGKNNQLSDFYNKTYQLFKTYGLLVP